MPHRPTQTKIVSPPLLDAREVEFSYDQVTVLRNVSASLRPGSLTALVGPNGSGKSTLLGALARLIRPQSGSVVLDGKPILRQPGKHVASRLAILPQNPPVPENLTVYELVSRGRYPHLGILGLWGEKDLAAVETAMQMTGTASLADHPVAHLSGGQRQRCWIAMALAQDTEVILLDEPTSALDLRYQLEILDLLRDLTRNHGRTVVVAMHDLNLAAAHADEMIFFKQGVVYGAGPTRAVCTAKLIQEVFDVAVTILQNPLDGTPVFVPGLQGMSP